MLLAITSEGKIGLGVLAGAFIVFALLCSFYFPRRNPDFPGNRLGLFVLVTTVLFVATMAGVVVFAKEEEEAHGAEATETHGTETGEEPATTEEPLTTTEETPTTTEEAPRRLRTSRRRPRRLLPSPRETRRRARPSSPRRAAAAVTRSRRPARPEASARTSTTRSPTTSSSSTG